MGKTEYSRETFPYWDEARDQAAIPTVNLNNYNSTSDYLLASIACSLVVIAQRLEDLTAILWEEHKT